MIKYSIIIATYNHLEDCLKPCIESIMRYTDVHNIEIIIVANGCRDRTVEYLNKLSSNYNFIKSIIIDEPIGYIKATNIGIKHSTGEYVILLNNDVEFLNQTKNYWLNVMMENLEQNKKAMIVGPLKLFDKYSGMDFIVFFCVMIKREVFDKIGLLNEEFSPGGGEDIEFCIRAINQGYEISCVGVFTYNQIKNTNVGSFPIWHKNNMTFNHIPEYGANILKRNNTKNAISYNKNIKISIGYSKKDCLSVGATNQFDILMDPAKLEFSNDSVAEIHTSMSFIEDKLYDVITVWKNKLKANGKLYIDSVDFCNPGKINQLFDCLLQNDFVDVVMIPIKNESKNYDFKIEAKKPSVSNIVFDFYYNSKKIKLNLFSEREFISSMIINSKKFYENELLVAYHDRHLSVKVSSI